MVYLLEMKLNIANGILFCENFLKKNNSDVRNCDKNLSFKTR